MKLIPIGGDRWINAELVMAVSVHSTNVTVTMVNGTEVIAAEVGCGGDKYLQYLRTIASRLIDAIYNANCN